MKFCPNCKYENEDDASFCKNCGKKFTTLNKKIKNKNKKEDILFIIGIITIIIIAIAGTYAYINWKEQKTIETPNEDKTITTIENNTTKNNTNNPTWHKIGTYTGIENDIISFNTQGNKVKIVSTGMPMKNYADNYLKSTLQQHGITLDESQSTWNSNSAVKSKTQTIEISGNGNFEILIGAYELQWWKIEIYQYY